VRHTLTGSILCAGLVALSGCGGADDTPEEAAPPVAAPAAPVPVADVTFLDPNTATREQLTEVPGVDSTLADALIAGRPFENMVGVDAVVANKLTPEQKDAAYERLWIPLDLNSASGAEILLIPRVGDNMAHEFEEYRPYDAIERWRREIGKYADSTEVARMEKYVTIR